MTGPSTPDLLARIQDRTHLIDAAGGKRLHPDGTPETVMDLATEIWKLATPYQRKIIFDPDAAYAEGTHSLYDAWVRNIEGDVGSTEPLSQVARYIQAEILQERKQYAELRRASKGARD